MPRLSVCLIVKNEERHLPRCLASVAGLADEIVVVDTGSTDRTVELARAHGARVVELVWQDDFSLAKNVSIEQATGDWILSIDADESIAARDHEAIRAVLGRDDVDAVLAAQRHYLTARTTVVGWQPGPGGYEEGAPYPGFVDVDCRRLFRNVPWLRFRNRVHEELVSIDRGRKLVEARGTWVLHHFGKVGEQELLRAKGVAYLRIGRKKVEDDPRSPQNHYELGVQHAELDQAHEAIACFTRTLELSREYRDVRFRIALCRFGLKQYREALAALRQSARTLPQHAVEIALVEGNVHRELGDERAAERAYRRALAHSPGFTPASLNLALLCSRQGRTDEALVCIDAALQQSPRHRDLQVLRARILARLRRFPEARDGLAVLGDGDQDPELSALRGAVALGLGDADGAATHLRRSLDALPTDEAAMNLSTALEARGDRSGALEAAAEAVRLSSGFGIRDPGFEGPHVALDRFAALAGDRLRRRARGAGTPELTIFFYQPYSMAYDGTTPRTRGLGGTESAIVYLAEALARRGHRAVVFNGCQAPSHVEGVEYTRWDTMPGRCLGDRPDVLVAVRFWQAVGRARFAPLQIFWTGDAFDQPFVETLADPDRRREIDLFMLQSDWQAETFQAHHQVPWGRVVRTTLGTAASSASPAIPAAPGPRPRRLVYASTPFRGLDVLLDVFPRIRAACPDAELEIYSSMTVYGVSEADDRRQFDGLYQKARQPGVTLVGSVPQLELARRLQEARVLAYPNHYRETFCIAAVEAQAAGCAVVTSELGALPETVGEAGICIPGDPRTPAYQRAFVDACVALLTDEARWQAMSGRALARAADYAWPVIAERWEGLCRAALVEEPAELERIALHLAAGRAGLAQRMLNRTAKPGDVSQDAWEALAAYTGWRAGQGQAPPLEQLRHATLAFRSLRALVVG